MLHGSLQCHKVHSRWCGRQLDTSNIRQVRLADVQCFQRHIIRSAIPLTPPQRSFELREAALIGSTFSGPSSSMILATMPLRRDARTSKHTDLTSTSNATEHIGTSTGHGLLWPMLPGLLQIHHGIPRTQFRTAPPIGSSFQNLGSSAHGFALKTARTIPQMPTPLVAIRSI